MGNRATVIFENAGGDGEPSPAVYLHWNGGPESIYSYLEEMSTRGWYRSDYAAARFVQIVGEHFSNEGADPGLSLGVFAGPDRVEVPDDLKDVPTDHGDNGFYIVRITAPCLAGCERQGAAARLFAVRRFTETKQSEKCDACNGTGALALEGGRGKKWKKVGTCTRCQGSGIRYTYPLKEWTPERVEAERAEAEDHKYREQFREMFGKLREWRGANGKATA